MARTAKKMGTKQSEEQTITVLGSVWKAGIYARLSVDNHDRKNESIETQIEIAKEYIGRTEDMELVDYYTDLGKTGTNFKREGFERMMADIRQKRINCVLVKDFSRFGRNYIETGNYIEKIFPFMKVRFIAVTDGYDSELITGDELQLSMSLKNIVNELYAKDIAKKVRTAKKVKQEMGSYTGGVPPYGYCAKKIGNRKVLFPNTDTKEIVVGIFEMYAAGGTYKSIAEDLYKRKIQRPMVYHATGEIYGSEDGELQQWPYETIKGILTNPAYIGTLFQARTCGKAFQDHRLHEVDKENDVTIVEHTHEPIISKDLFFKVSRRFERQDKYSNSRGFSKKFPLSKDIFKDRIYCGKCGQRFTRGFSVKRLSSGDRVRSYYYSCLNKRRIDSAVCNCQGISFETLLSIVKSALEKEFALSKMRQKDYCRENTIEAEKKKAVAEKETIEVICRRESLTLEGSRLYSQYREGEISREEFLKAKKEIEEEQEKLENLEKQIEHQSRRIEREAEKTNRFIRRLMRSKANAEFDCELVECLIKKIIVYSGQQIEVIFNYKKNDLFCGRE